MKDFMEAIKTPLPEGVRRLSKSCAWAVIAIWPVVLIFGVEKQFTRSRATSTVFLGIHLYIPPEIFYIISSIFIIIIALVLAPKIAKIILWVKDGFNLSVRK